MDFIALAKQIAQELPAAEIYPFADRWDAARVCEKWFALFTEHQGNAIINLKADPADAKLLCETYEGITPGYHMNKKHWISVYAHKDVNDQLLRELIIDSYLNVVASLPKAMQPVHPERFARESSSPQSVL